MMMTMLLVGKNCDRVEEQEISMWNEEVPTMYLYIFVPFL
jgi:hypothetical protein